MATKRAGRTVKVSVSLDSADLDVLRQHADDQHDGNLSATFAEAARWIRQRAARDRLTGLLGGGTLTAAAAAAIDAEQAGGPRYEPKRPKSTRAA